MDTKNNYHIHLKMLLTKDWIHFLCEGEQIPTELTVALSTRKNFREGSIRDKLYQCYGQRPLPTHIHAVVFRIILKLALKCILNA